MRLRYILRRFCWAVFVLFGSSIVVFLVLHVIPGDPARAMLGPDASPDAVATLRVQLGLDRSLTYQYVIWLSQMSQGDMGRSILLSQNVASLLAERLPITLLLSAYALCFAILIAIPVSVISATRKNTAADYAGRFLALIGLAMPSFWLGIMLILLFGVRLKVLPVFGYVAPMQDLLEHFRHMILPTVSLGMVYSALLMETNRNSLIEVLQQDYIRTARAGGLRERLVLYKYAMRNALIPTVTVIGIQVGYLMSGALIVETVFAIPGIGRLLVNAVLARDYPVVQGTMLVTVFIFSAVNLVVDLLYVVIDPRLESA